MAEVPVRFTISHDGWVRPILVATGFLERWSWVEVNADTVQVHMSWGFRATIDRSAIVEASPGLQRVWSIGVHGWRGRWLVNGSTKNLVWIRIDPAARARVMGLPIKLRELVVNVDDPERLLELLEQPT